jgi:predicted DNA-binding protein (MmcQ/YjbR family)
MTPEELRTCCLNLTGATETFPFGPETSVFKTNEKIFAITALGSPILDVSVKCDPELGEALRQAHAGIVPGYHLNKRHWITVTLNSDVSDEQVRQLIEDSYDLVRPRGRARRG